ncbi:hypothetical protein Patl1_06167 [Pistacia atlantica]|uniref:Uncharacterized protein n=1 Tax=Pistacia atlantica TaxID=434234 RepID=A0ACC1BWH7_9ROSI|nr:hypothetical protein Patl1_06167 [Pistacia atlantica]
MEMPSNHVQEFQFSKFSESRKKVDSHHMENSAEIIWQKKKNSLEYESKIDHRKSLAWDSAFFTSPGILDPEELFEGLNFRDVASESLEQERTKRNCEINTRRSLAWDSAFFTSAGVLDPEELCLLHIGKRKWLAKYPLYEEIGCFLCSEDEIFKEAKSLQKRIRKESEGGFSSSTSTGMLSIPLSALKPPKASVQVNSPLITPSKRASSGSNNIIMESKAKKSAPGQHMIASKRPCLGKSSPKSPSLSSHTPMNKSAGLGAAKYDSASRSSQNPLIALFIYCPPSSPLRTSPSSSINMWSSESSASINQRSISSTGSLDNTCEENSSDHDFSHALDSERHICDRNCFTQGDRDNRFVNQHAKTNSMRNSSVLANISKSIKPSSLRMPSPKIGYFDAQYSVALTPKGDMRFHSGVHSSSSKTGSGVANHNGVATRTMRGKLQQWGTLSEIDSQKTGGLCHPLGNSLCGSASSKKDKVNLEDL